MDPRLHELEQKIHAARAGEKSVAEKQKKRDEQNANDGLHAGFELVGAIAAGVFIGYWLDTWLGTMPLFLIVMFFLGVFTGFYNIYRLMNNLGTGPGISILHPQQKDATKTPSSNKDSG
jgi:ATP synthase protein I